MAECKSLIPVEVTRTADFGYPAGAYVTVKQGGGITIHEIYYAGAPLTDFDNAPNGTILYDTTNGNIYQKRGTLGLADGTWKYQAINT